MRSSSQPNVTMLEQATSRVRTVLVAGDGNDAVAVTTWIVVRALESPKGPRIRYRGSVSFDRSTKTHYSRLLLPIVDGISGLLGQNSARFEISAINVGAASTRDIGVRISGMSADIPIFLAMLSASLNIAIPDDVVFTGHIASSDGDIRMVRNIPAKLAAAIDDETVSTFVCPALKDDLSLLKLAPGERDRIEAAVAAAKLRVNVITVSGIHDLVERVLRPEAIVLGSLGKGFFGRKLPPPIQPNNLWGTAKHISRDSEKRFVDLLEEALLDGDSGKATLLLGERIEMHVRRGEYPSGLGTRLASLIQSLPPATRRIRIKFPLIPPALCLAVARCASESDHDDVRNLLDFASRAPVPTRNKRCVSDDDAPKTDENAEDALDTVLAEIDPDNLAERIGEPIDAARASYAMESVVAESNDEFMDLIASFFLHMLRHTQVTVGPSDVKQIGADAFALLTRAFARRGGPKAALAEALGARRGGMRYVLDVMTDQYKVEQQEKHVLQVLKEAIDPSDWAAEVAFMKAFLARHAPDLPPEIASAPPEKFAGQHELVVRTYVRSMETVKDLLRAL